MKKQQVRPRVDKDVYDSVSSYYAGKFSFNDSLRNINEHNKWAFDNINKIAEALEKAEQDRDKWLQIANKVNSDYETALGDLHEAQSKGIRYSIITFCCGLALGLSSAHIYVNYL